MASKSTVSVIKITKHQLPKELKEKLKRAVETVMQGEGFFSCKEVSVVLLNDENIRELNRCFLNHDYPTDVLSFRLDEDTQMQPRKETLVGEIIISVETAQRNAKRYKQTLEKELIRLVIHGTLHLLGYEDAKEKQRRKMKRKEKNYMRQLCI
ncbi:MAG: rRNA maturation RNase YbeY [Armatimonadetes bacterium]|nr:rRNA maturation RNase YbeY [Armatimonadota bacterium]